MMNGNSSTTRIRDQHQASSTAWIEYCEFCKSYYWNKVVCFCFHWQINSFSFLCVAAALWQTMELQPRKIVETKIFEGTSCIVPGRSMNQNREFFSWIGKWIKKTFIWSDQLSHSAYCLHIISSNTFHIRISFKKISSFFLSISFSSLYSRTWSVCNARMSYCVTLAIANLNRVICHCVSTSLSRSVCMCSWIRPKGKEKKWKIMDDPSAQVLQQNKGKSNFDFRTEARNELRVGLGVALLKIVVSSFQKIVRMQALFSVCFVCTDDHEGS